MVNFGKLKKLAGAGARAAVKAGLARVGGVEGATRMATAALAPRLSQGIQAVAGYKKGGVIVVRVVKKKRAVRRRRA